MYGSLDISTSGMVAQRIRLDTISTNLANIETVRDSKGEINPFRRRSVQFAPGDPSAPSKAGRQMGVHVQEIWADPDAVTYRWAPGHPDAFKDGPWKDYKPVPDINPVVENINAMEAARAYEANVVAAEASKSMMAQALRLIA